MADSQCQWPMDINCKVLFRYINYKMYTSPIYNSIIKQKIVIRVSDISVFHLFMVARYISSSLYIYGDRRYRPIHFLINLHLALSP